MAGDDNRQYKLRQLAGYRRKVAQLEAQLELGGSDTDSPEASQRRMVSDRVVSTANIAGAIAHEINNPLVTCQGYIRRALRWAAQHGDQELLDTLDRLSQGARRIQAIVGELQLLSEGIVGEIERLDLADIVERVARLVLPELRDNLSLDLQAARVLVDRPQLYQLVYNLMTSYLIEAARTADGRVEVRCGAGDDGPAWLDVAGPASPSRGTRTDLLATIRGDDPSPTLSLRLARQLTVDIGGRWQEADTADGRYHSTVHLPTAASC